MASSPSVVILGKSTFKPLNPTDRHRMLLSPIDLHHRYFAYVPVILFYKTEIEYVSFVDTLKQGLSAVLAHFYPLAGRLLETDDGMLGLDCNDEGVEFVEASLDVPFSELEEASFAMHDFFRALVRFEGGQRSDSPDDPLLYVQVTRFSSGGIAVGCAFNHVIVDGHSLWHFMNSWAQCCRGLSVSVPPLHTRTALLKPGNLSRRLEIQTEVPDFKPPGETTDSSGISPSSDQQEVQLTEDVIERLKRNATAEAAKPPTSSQRVVHLTVDMIKRLKARANAEAGKVPITSFQAFTAYFWKRLTMAQEPLDESRKVVLYVPVNARGRMVPPLSSAYFGNVVVGTRVLATAGELRGESLGATAARIHEAIRCVDEKYIEGQLRRRDFTESLLLLTLERRMTTIGQSPRFPVYDTDFGWGKPASVRSPAGAEGLLMLYPGKEEGSVDVCFALPPPTMKAFLSQEDDELLKD